MKSDVVYGLVNATWPVILVDEAGAIHNVNPVAVRTFGPSMADGTGSLSTLWGSANTGTPAELLTRCASQAAVNVPLNLIGKGDKPLAYSVSICTMLDEGKKYFLCQLLP